MATDAEGKKLSDLRVVDLRAELEKRGLDKTGVKAALLERLQKALLQEGRDPDEYEFELNDKKPVKRLSTSQRTEEVDNSAETSANDSNILMIETPSLEQEADKDGGHEEETKNNDKNEDSKNDHVSAESPLNISIGEEEEELLNSGDEHDQSANSTRKDEDEKTAANQSNVDDTKKSDSATVKADDKEDELNDSANNVDSSADNHEDKFGDDDDEDNNRSSGRSGRSNEDAKKDDVASVGNGEASSTTTTTATTSSTTTTTSSTTAQSASSSNGATVASDKESSKSDKEADKDKDKEKNSKGNPGRSLWVTNLLPSTRAQELKHLLSKYGKVIGAKVVQSSRYPRQRCYGYVTMETRAAADLCIEKLTNTELKGQIIRVAKVRPEHSLPSPMNKKKEDSVEKDKRKKTPPKSSSSSKSERKEEDKKKDSAAASASDDKKKDDTAKKDKEAPKEKEKDKEERDRSRKSSRESTGRKRSSLTKTSSARVERKSDILTFDKIREERERQRQRERERAMREEEKRRREIARAREIEKRQREEAMRLEREREKLRMERDRLDRQRAEIMRLERERQRLEREKLEQERQELRRAQMKLEEARRPVKRPSSSTTTNYRRESGGTYGTDDRKRMVTDRHYDETPPPPRFEVANRDSTTDISKSKEIPKDYKSRLAYSSKRAEEYPPKRSSGSEFKRDYPPTDRHSGGGGGGGHPSHLVHSIGNSASSSKYESSSYVNREREREIREPTRRDTIVPNVPPPRISKDARYTERTGERSPVSYRAVRDERERRQVSDHHSSKGEIRSSRDHRYPEPSMKEGARYREGGNSWHSAPVKPFSNIGGGSAASSRDSWNKTDTWRPMEANTNERWGNSSSRMLMSGTSGVPNSIFSGGSSTLGISAGLSCPPPPGNSSYPMDRFESSFKSLNSSRKY